jgi:putative spermidine/putrescine transport system ATP-binding protein
MALLGPSGCGKTTTLRIIAGFEKAEQGHVFIDDQEVTRLPPRVRNIGIVFQNYALFPHLTVAENVGFGLKMRGESRAAIVAAVRTALDLVQLSGVEGRLPHQLSGGQQQRVAVARALAIKPCLLLLDEPLSNLDAKLRDELREEIRRVQQRIGITTIFVTHDQGEALAMSDRIAVMRDGVVMQEGSPDDIYRFPQNAFVASFIGRATLLHGHVVATDGRVTHCETNAGLAFIGRACNMRAGEKIVGVIRTERIRLGATMPENVFDATVESATYLGSVTRLFCSIGSDRFEVVRSDAGDAPHKRKGDRIALSWAASDCAILPADD